MSIEDAGVIDFIGTDKENGAVGLLISDPLEWRENKLDLLRAKLTAYLDYIASGGLEATYPAAGRRALYIELVYHHQPDDSALKALAQLQEKAAESGVGFRWSPWRKELH